MKRDSHVESKYYSEAELAQKFGLPPKKVKALVRNHPDRGESYKSAVRVFPGNVFMVRAGREEGVLGRSH